MFSIVAAAQGIQITQMNLPESLLMSLLGMGIVMLTLTAIMFLARAQSAVLTRFTRHAVAGGAMPEAETPPPAKKQGVPALGSVGEIALHGVPDRTAALIMAIVADELQAPLNELRFISIREIE